MNQLIERILTVGDRRTPLTDALTDSSGAAIDLTGHTVALRMVAEDGTVKINSAAGSVDSPATNGYVTYNWAAGDVDTAGTYWYWWVVTRTSDGKVEHFPADGRKRKIVFMPSE